MSNEKFYNALNRIPQNCPPIWFMRQAGRYHKHYQNLRSKHSFIELCKNPKLAAEVALGPIEDFDFDVSIMFSDLLFPLEALGMGLEYSPGPKLNWHLNETNISKLLDPNLAAKDLEFQKEVLIETRRRLPAEKSLIGFVGGAWTLFTYAVEGGHNGNMIKSKSSLGLWGSFNEHLLPLLKQNIKWQLDGGAEIVIIFDTSAGTLSSDLFAELVVPTLQLLANEFPGKLGYYGKPLTTDHYALLQNDKLFLAGMGFDHRFSMSSALQLNNKGFSQGNFDQSLLFLDHDNFAKTLAKYLQPLSELSPEKRKGWVCGLGHGVLPQTPEENVHYFVKTLRSMFS